VSPIISGERDGATDPGLQAHHLLLNFRQGWHWTEMIEMRVLIASGFILAAAGAACADPQQQPPSADLAKKCQQLSAKAYPPAVAGSKKGDAGAERTYFASCIKNGGNPDKPQ
jgi:hypothetical protein